MPDPAEQAAVSPASAAPGPVRIRPARFEDAEAIAAIHNQGIQERSATFETTPRSPGLVRERLSDATQPVMVAERDGAVVAWASVTRSNDRSTQSGVGEYTIYVDRAARRAGIGAPLIEALAEAAEANGYWKLVGRIFTTNESSLTLARRCGFYEVGIHRRHGCLEGRWLDVVVVERLMGSALDDG